MTSTRADCVDGGCDGLRVDLASDLDLKLSQFEHVTTTYSCWSLLNETLEIDDDCRKSVGV